MPSWVKTKKESNSGVIQQTVVNTGAFSDMQSFAYSIIETHLQLRCPKDLLLLIIIGGAGTGKSYLIHAIRNPLKR